MNITKIKEGFDKLTFTLSDRITTATDMFHYMKQLNTEQETVEGFDSFRESVRATFGEEVILEVYPNFFTGKEDVIIEFECNFTIIKGSSLETKHLCSEHFLGTFLTEFKKHFDCYYRYADDSTLAVVKQHFRY